MVSVQIAALVVALSASGETALLDFHAPWCAPCRSMEGTIAELERAGYPVRKVDVEQDRHLARQFNVQNIPCFVLVVDGREVGRLTGAVGRGELEAMLARAGVRRGSSGRRETTRAQSPDPPPRAIETSARGPAASGEDLIAASVRLKISDPQGASHGTGTLIDSRQGEALVLTCGHIFRDSQGKGEITVELCGQQAPQKLPGRLVGYDLASDVGLVSIKPGVPVRAATLAPKGYRVAPGDRVLTVGCNNGGPATLEESSISAVNKFRAPPNLSVAGLPVQGRSGGGLFTAEGLVIGVCNAADPADNEGLYAALPVIQDELDKVGLAAIYQDRSPSGAVATNDVAAVEPMPGPAAEVTVAADRGVRVMPANVGALDDAERAALAGIQSVGNGAEVICIVRPLSDSQAKSEVILLDRASSALLKQLAIDRQAQESRHLTSLKVRARPQRQPAR